MPDCPEEVGLEEYNLTIKGSNFPVNVAYKVDLPKNVGTSVYNSEVLAPVTSRIIAVKVAQSSNLGELRSLTLTLVEESEGPGNGPRGGSPTPLSCRIRLALIDLLFSAEPDSENLCR